MAVYGLLHSNVFKDFPALKIVVSHGGGAVPYHAGRLHASALRRNAIPLVLKGEQVTRG